MLVWVPYHMAITGNKIITRKIEINISPSNAKSYIRNISAISEIEDKYQTLANRRSEKRTDCTKTFENPPHSLQIPISVQTLIQREVPQLYHTCRPAITVKHVYLLVECPKYNRKRQNNNLPNNYFYFVIVIIVMLSGKFTQNKTWWVAKLTKSYKVESEIKLILVFDENYFTPLKTYWLTNNCRVFIFEKNIEIFNFICLLVTEKYAQRRMASWTWT